MWGVGHRIAQRQQRLGICTVLDLKRAGPKKIRQGFSVVMERTVAELNGVACLALDDVAEPKKQIMRSRSFGVLVSAHEALHQAVVAYTTRACEKLRRQRSVAGTLQVFIRTNPFRENAPQYQRGITLAPPEPTDDTRVLVHLAAAGLKQIYRDGFAYQKAGVVLNDLTAAGRRQVGLYDDTEQQERAQRLMTTLDRINHAYGCGTLRLAGEGLSQPWKAKASRQTPRYTTRIDELAIAKAL